MASQVDPGFFGVFCLEGQWFSELDYQASLRGMLDMLKSWEVIDDFIYRDVGTAEEFRKFAERWAGEQDYLDYRIAYFASHGDSGRIWLDSDVSVALPDLSKILEGRCHGQLIHLGGCSTLATGRREIGDFLRRTSARAVCGYTEDVDTIEAAALEMVWISELANKTRIGDGLNAFCKHPIFESVGRKLGFEIWD
jgi:hypothetical protein